MRTQKHMMQFVGEVLCMASSAEGTRLSSKLPRYGFNSIEQLRDVTICQIRTVTQQATSIFREQRLRTWASKALQLIIILSTTTNSTNNYICPICPFIFSYWVGFYASAYFTSLMLSTIKKQRKIYDNLSVSMIISFLRQNQFLILEQLDIYRL